MLVYTGIKRDFINSVENGTIAREVRDAIEQKLGRHTPESEYRAFDNSLPQMHIVLKDDSIPDNAGIAIEYNLPLTSKRVDFIISGYDASNTPGVVIIELKQWDKLTAINGMDALVETYIGGGMHRLVHPSYQAWSYSALLEDYNQTVQKQHITLVPCAYLHNYFRSADVTDPIDAEQYRPYLDKAPAFTKGQVAKLRQYIHTSIRKGDNKTLLYQIENGKLKPSKSLQDTIGSLIKGNSEFVMIDDQKLVYEEILRLSEQSKKDNKKRTVIVQGGPGTGKSVIAINLLAQLTLKGQFVQYTSKNASPRTVYKKRLEGNMKNVTIDNMFTGSGSYTETADSYVDTILADEAHRLAEKSGLYHNMGENQIKEIIHASKCSVFFIDESQRVTLSDIGSVQEIKDWARSLNSEVSELQLTSQFRCNGSDGYLAWLDDLLEIRSTSNYDIESLNYDFRVCDSPEELYSLILDKNEENHRSRMVAGYCWNWPSAEQNNPDFHDIQIGNFGISWNLKNYTFAITDESIHQAGCIHTTQGLEFDYVGVIIGDDLRYSNGKILTDFTKRAKTDKSLSGIKKLYKEDKEKALKVADEIIKNTYRTLMTRGMKGCYIYCTDSSLSNYIRSRLEPLPKDDSAAIDYTLQKQDVIDLNDYIEIPILGPIAAGYGITMTEDIEGKIFTPKTILHPAVPDKYFWLRVCGDSMINKDICNGDYALIRRMSNQTRDIHIGDVVACQIHSDEATLKTFAEHNDSHITLHPENSMYDDIVVPMFDFVDGEARIIGKMVELVHSADLEFNEDEIAVLK